MKVGVLALQGDFAKHAEMLKSLNITAIEVRQQKDLNLCHGLIIPGGESTVMVRQMDLAGLRQPILSFARKNPVFGTCAGLILMSKEIQYSSFHPLNLLDITVKRNAYGRQIASFEASVDLHLKNEPETLSFPALFIRAPQISCYSSSVQVLAYWESAQPILVRQGHHLGATFHPEFSNASVHRYFIEMIKGKV